MENACVSGGKGTYSGEYICNRAPPMIVFSSVPVIFVVFSEFFNRNRGQSLHFSIEKLQKYNTRLLVELPAPEPPPWVMTWRPL